MKLLTAFIVATFLMPSAVITWTTDFEKAKTEASTNKKLILLNFCGSDWCIPCIKLKKEIFESDVFSQFADSSLVLLKADFPRLAKNKLDKKQTAHNEMLAEKYNPNGAFPFTVLLDSDGKVLKSWDGLPKVNAEAFTHEIAQLKEAK